jgi:hypothetical protein
MASAAQGLSYASVITMFEQSLSKLAVEQSSSALIDQEDSLNEHCSLVFSGVHQKNGLQVYAGLAGIRA